MFPFDDVIMICFIPVPKAEDSGYFKCRTTLAFSNLVNIDSAESLTTANVLVLGELEYKT